MHGMSTPHPSAALFYGKQQLSTPPPPYRTVEAWLASAFHEDNLYLPHYRGMARGSFSMRATYTYLTAGAWVWAAFHEGSLYRLFFSPAGKTVTVLGRSYDCPCKALALC